MKDAEFRETLRKRRTNLGMTYKEIQRRTKLGYNTVRRVFDDPSKCRISSVILVARSMDCDLIFAIEDQIGDELEPENPVDNGPVAK